MTKNKKACSSANYRDYVIKDGQFIGAFEEMYRNIEDPWNHGNARAIQYDLVLLLLQRNGVCKDGGRILDIGCGKGAFTSRIQDSFPHCSITGIDISSTAIKFAKKNHHSSNTEFFTLDIQEDYRSITSQYNLVVMSQLIGYILPRLDEIVSYITKSVLAENGYLVINQAFYKPQEQTYGKEIISTVEDLLKYVKMPSLEMIESNRLTNHDAVILFRKE